MNASLLSAPILPLATAFNVCEGMGFEFGVNRRFSEAPIFYMYTLLMAAGAGCVLVPKLPLLKLILLSQAANGVLLPFVLIFMLVLVNRKTLLTNFAGLRRRKSFSRKDAEAKDNSKA